MLCVRGHDDGVHGRREKEGAGPRASRGHSCSSRGEEDGRIFFFFCMGPTPQAKRHANEWDGPQECS